jgi:RND family efflux transporter MFP subunit
VNAQPGDIVPAGFVIAALENSTESASVLSAEGSYEAAVAASQTVAPAQVKTNALNAYTSAYSTLDTTLTQYIDTFFGDETAFGPELLVSAHSIDPSVISRERRDIDDAMNTWQASLSSVNGADANALLQNATSVAQKTSTLLSNLAKVADERSSNVNVSQLTALATARTTVNTLLATLSTAQAAYNSQSQANNAGGNASVKQALGALRLAQANYEKTVIRAPIAGTINSLSIRVGDYVSALQHVATVAQAGALEITAQIGEDSRNALTVGTKVIVDAKYPGTVTNIAPGLDPVTKQIQVRIAVSGNTDLVDGQSVRVSLPVSAALPVTTTATSTGPILLPLAAVKLTADNRVLFSVDASGRLVAIPVTIGEVRGDRIEITSPVSGDTRIVTDARGLSEGEHVNVASTTGVL